MRHSCPQPDSPVDGISEPRAPRRAVDHTRQAVEPGFDGRAIERRPSPGNCIRRPIERRREAGPVDHAAPFAAHRPGAPHRATFHGAQFGRRRRGPPQRHSHQYASGGYASDCQKRISLHEPGKPIACTRRGVGRRQMRWGGVRPTRLPITRIRVILGLVLHSARLFLHTHDRALPRPNLYIQILKRGRTVASSGKRRSRIDALPAQARSRILK